MTSSPSALATLVVAIDGPSGSGKSTVSRQVATHLGLRYLDTGAMYRALTWWMLQHEVDVDDADAVAAAAPKPVVEVGTDPVSPTVSVDGLDVSGPIRDRPVSNAVSAVSAVPEVRALMRARQQEVVGSGGVVVEGRDIGTAVAPDALVKVYLTAAPDTRAQRRTAELSHDPAANLELTAAELARRDRLDSGRAASPLAKAPDAHELDTTALSPDEVLEAVLALVHLRMGG
ncbi:(d)CMP kinase [soil metagenome]